MITVHRNLPYEDFREAGFLLEISDKENEAINSKRIIRRYKKHIKT